jgi:hypothetical protein
MGTRLIFISVDYSRSEDEPGYTMQSLCSLVDDMANLCTISFLLHDKNCQVLRTKKKLPSMNRDISGDDFAL